MWFQGDSWFSLRRMEYFDTNDEWCIWQMMMLLCCKMFAEKTFSRNRIPIPFDWIKLLMFQMRTTESFLRFSTYFTVLLKLCKINLNLSRFSRTEFVFFKKNVLILLVLCGFWISNKIYCPHLEDERGATLNNFYEERSNTVLSDSIL